MGNDADSPVALSPKKLLLRQLEVLVWKDWWLMKSHKKTLAAEVLIPIIVAILAAVSVYLQIFSHPNGSYYPNSNGYDIGGPESARRVPYSSWNSGGNSNSSNALYVDGCTYYRSSYYNASNYLKYHPWYAAGCNMKDSNSWSTFISAESGVVSNESQYQMGSYFFKQDNYGREGFALNYTSWMGTLRYHDWMDPVAHHESQSLKYKNNYYNGNVFWAYNTSEEADAGWLEWMKQATVLSQYFYYYNGYFSGITPADVRSVNLYNSKSVRVTLPSVEPPFEKPIKLGQWRLSAKDMIKMQPQIDIMYYGQEKQPIIEAAAGAFYGTEMGFDSRFNQYQLAATICGIILHFAFIPMSITTGGRLVDEKRTKMREHLRVMGVEPIAYISSLYVFGLLRVTIITALMTVSIFAVGSDLGAANIMSSMVSLWFFGFSLLGFSTLMPCLFQRSMMSAATICVFVLAFVAGGVLGTDPHVPSEVQWIGALLFSPTASVMAIAQLLGNNLVPLAVPPGVAIVFLIMQGFWYCALSQYLYALWPGEYGVPQRWYFPFYQLKRLCTSTTSVDERSGARYMGTSNAADAEYSIILNELYKYYGSQRDTAAVNGLSLQIRKGEIFALLGHNGAGKTTTISMLTGMLQPTNYKEASINGMDLTDDIDLIRQQIGICPQFDILFEDLSGIEHMQIFSAFKGVSDRRGKALLESLGLPLDQQKVHTYSGGMKRRLSVACSVIGGSPVLFLDEPSSGLDPLSRRQLWDMIRAERNLGKTVILTTHFMEEADYLGERIAIMSHGQLYCCDTATALKQRYGVGYYLTCVKSEGPSGAIETANPAGVTGVTIPTGTVQNQSAKTAAPLPGSDSAAVAPAEGVISFNLESTLKLLESYAPGSSIVQDSLGDATFLLPAEHLKNFGPLLAQFEAQMEGLGISSYGIRMNSLEDVFVKISESESSEKNGTVDPLDMSAFNTETLMSGQSVERLFAASAHDFGPLRFLSQVVTVLRKKFLHLRRAPRMVFLCIVVPLLFITIGWAACIDLVGQVERDISNSQGYYAQTYDNYEIPVGVPDYSNWQIGYIGEPTENQTWILDRMIQLASQNASKFPKYDPKKPFNVRYKVFSVLEGNFGSYVDMKSIAFTASGKQSYVIGNPFIYNSDRYYYGRQNYQHMNYTLNWGFNWPRGDHPVIAYQLYQCLKQAALEHDFPELAPEYPGPAPMTFYDLPKPSVADLTPTRQEEGLTSGGSGGSSHGSSRASSSATPGVTSSGDSSSSSASGSDMGPEPPTYPQAWLAIPAGICSVFAIAVYAACQCLQVADELGRRIVHTLRLHGLSSLAYWTGTLIFDVFFGGIWILAAMIAGPYLRDIPIMTQEGGEFVIFLSYVVFGNILFALLFTYAFMTMFPNFKPNIHIAATVGFSIFFMVLPVLISLKWFNASPPPCHYVENTYVCPPAPDPPVSVLAMTPQSSLFWVFNNVTKNYNMTAHPFDNSVNTEVANAMVQNTYLWLILPIFILWFNSTAFFRSTVHVARHGVLDKKKLKTLNPDRPNPGAAEIEGGEPISAAQGGNLETTLLLPNDNKKKASSPDGGQMNSIKNQLETANKGRAMLPITRKAYYDEEVVDEDVIDEQHRVENNLALAAGLGPGASGGDMVQGIHLVKEYGLRKMERAVDDATFGVRSGECFGLLGPNGAGKTSTVKMLLKENGCTRGYIRYPYTNLHPQSFSLDDDYQQARLGVCQQNDTLWETFTDREHMDLYLRIRLGFHYNPGDWRDYITAATKKVYLEDAENKHAGSYSGGMKRKLAVALALYSGAKTVFLDEPSTGMDPYARRAMWKSIKEALSHEKGVILTTHSMEEADAVCARIAIVAKGKMQCIGSSQHLKNKFGTGYAITLVMKDLGTRRNPEANSDDVNNNSSSRQSLLPGDIQPLGYQQQATQDAQQQQQQLRQSQQQQPQRSSQYLTETEIAEKVEERIDAMDLRMMETFGGDDNDCERSEAQTNMLVYRLGNLDVPRAFSKLAEVSEEWGLESYSVNQVTSLEQIFLEFTAQEEDKLRRDKKNLTNKMERVENKLKEAQQALLKAKAEQNKRDAAAAAAGNQSAQDTAEEAAKRDAEMKRLQEEHAATVRRLEKSQRKYQTQKAEITQLREYVTELLSRCDSASAAAAAPADRDESGDGATAAVATEEVDTPRRAAIRAFLTAHLNGAQAGSSSDRDESSV